MADQPDQGVNRIPPPDFGGKTLIGNETIAVGAVIAVIDGVVAVAVVAQNILTQTSGEIPDPFPVPGTVEVDTELLRVVFPPVQRSIELDAGQIAHSRPQRGNCGQYPVGFGIIEFSVTDPAGK